MRVFYFNRIKDISGVSGTGRVADGVEFDNGRAAVCWRTPTSSIEIWQSLSECMQVHSHGDATQIVFVDDELKQRGTDLDQILDALEAQTSEVTPEVLRSLHKALSHSLPGVYVSFDGDSIGNKVALAEERDDEESIRDISERIRAGGDLFHKWVQRHDGVELEQGGDEGLAKVPEKALEDLETFRTDYSRLVSATVTVGVGRKISEATKARMLGKLKGKNRIETFSDSTESQLKAALEARGPQDEASKIREAGFAKAFKELEILLKSQFKESDHPRAADGEFTSGSGKTASKNSKPGRLMGSGASLDQIKQGISKFYMSPNIKLEQVGENHWAVHNAKGPIDGVQVRHHKDRYRFESIESEENESKKKVQKSLEFNLFQALEVIEKAKPLPVGTVKQWGGKKYQKQAQGWIPVPGQPRKGGGDEPESSRFAKPAPLSGERRKTPRHVDAGGHIKRELSPGGTKPEIQSPVQARSNQHREADHTIREDNPKDMKTVLDEVLQEMSPANLNFSAGQKALAKHVDYSKIEQIPNTATTKFGGVVGTTLNGRGQKVLVKSALPTDEAFSTAHKEVAYFNCSRFFGLSHMVPECAGDQQEGKFYSVAEWKHGAQPYDPRDREHYQGLVDDGTVHKAAVMNMLLGNVDRHGGNWLVKDHQLLLIDNGFAFGYNGGARLPGSGGQIKSRTPRYLRLLLDDDPGDLEESDFQAAISAVETPEHIANWVKSLSEDRLMQVLEQSRVPDAAIRQALQGLQRAKQFVDRDASFGGLVQVLLHNISGKGESE